MQTERITFLASAEQKAAIDAFAARSGRSVGHVVREATTRYISEDAEDEEMLAALLIELAAAVPEMKASLERTAQNMEDALDEVDRKMREAGLWT